MNCTLTNNNPPALDLNSPTLARDVARALADMQLATVFDAHEILSCDDGGPNGVLVTCNGHPGFADAAVRLTGTGLYDGLYTATIIGTPDPTRQFFIGAAFVDGSSGGRWEYA